MQKPDSKLSWTISVICLGVIIIHAFFPDITFDSNTMEDLY